MKRTMLFLPLIIFLVMAFLLYGSLGKDPQFLPSALLGKPMPDFELTTLGAQGRLITENDLAGQASLLNVWASWCYACRIEHPFLTKIAKQYKVPLYGLNYKNDADEALRWLEEFGNPYLFSLYDREGLLGIDLGVAGAPETFVLDDQGMIRMRHIGIVDEKVWATKFKPLLNELGAL